MRAVLQRVKKASISINNKEFVSICEGILIFIGIEHQDEISDAKWLSSKISKLRIFSKENNLMNYSIKEVSGDVLVVSQFTLHAKVKKGSRPSFVKSADKLHAKRIYKTFKDLLSNDLDFNVKSGEFGKDMQVSLINDGPVTIIINTKNKE